MGIRERFFGSSEKDSEFKANQPVVPAAETPITPENKQNVLPDPANYSAEHGKMVADTEKVVEVPTQISKLEAVINAVDAHKEELPKQN